MMWSYGYDGWSWLWMGGMMLFFWGGVILLGFWAIRSFAGPRRDGDQALEVLRRRFASGEITQEEFDKSRKALQA